MAIRLLNSHEASYSGWQILRDPECEFTEEFFKKILEHPNNGGLNSNPKRFSAILFQLYHIQNFKDYLEAHPESSVKFESIYNTYFHDSEEEKD